MATKGSERAADTRARLMSAAVETFASKGFHGTTTRDIANAAGISPTALYVHHQSKEELLYLISRSGHEEALRVVTEAVSGEGDAVDRVRRMMHDFAAHHARLHLTARVVNYELSALSEDHFAEIQALRRQLTDSIRGLIQDGVASGELNPPNPTFAVTALISMAVDIARWFRAGHHDPAEVATAYAEMAVRLVRHP